MMYSLARLNRAAAFNIRYTPLLHINRNISSTIPKLNSDNGIPWFVQKYENEEESNPLSLDGALRSLEDRENLTIKYSDDIIFEKDPPENIEDFEKVEKLNTNILKELENLKILLNFKDVTIINSPLRTHRDYFILMNSMDSKQHNDRIMGALKTHLKKLNHEGIQIDKLKVSGFRNDYLSKRKRIKMNKKLAINNGFVNTRFFKKSRMEKMTNEQIESLFTKGTDKSWGMLKFELVTKKKDRYSFEVHVLSPLQRTLLNFEELYQIEGIHPGMMDMMMLMQKDQEFYRESRTKYASFGEGMDQIGSSGEKEGSIFEELEEISEEETKEEVAAGGDKEASKL